MVTTATFDFLGKDSPLRALPPPRPPKFFEARVYGAVIALWDVRLADCGG